MKIKFGILVLAATLLVAGSYADTFGTGQNQFSIDFVTIGNAGNPGDARSDASPIRRVVDRVRHPRRRALPDTDQKADDRMVGAGDP